MSAVDPRNVGRRLAVALRAVLPAGMVIIPDGDDQAPTAAVSRWVRLTLSDIDATYAGLLLGAKASLQRILVTVDVFQRGAVLGASGAASVDAIDGLVGTVRTALSATAYPIPDYVSDPSGATPTTRALQIPGVATTQRLDPIDGVQRRQVTTIAFLLAEV